MAGTEKKNRAVVIEPLYRWRPKKFNAEQREELQRKYPDIELIFDENIPVLPNLDTAGLLNHLFYRCKKNYFIILFIFVLKDHILFMTTGAMGTSA